MPQQTWRSFGRGKVGSATTLMFTAAETQRLDEIAHQLNGNRSDVLRVAIDYWIDRSDFGKNPPTWPAEIHRPPQFARDAVTDKVALRLSDEEREWLHLAGDHAGRGLGGIVRDALELWVRDGGPDDTVPFAPTPKSQRGSQTTIIKREAADEGQRRVAERKKMGRSEPNEAELKELEVAVEAGDETDTVLALRFAVPIKVVEQVRESIQTRIERAREESIARGQARKAQREAEGRKTLSDEELAEAAKLKAQNWTIADVAREFGVSRQAMHQKWGKL